MSENEESECAVEQVERLPVARSIGKLQQGATDELTTRVSNYLLHGVPTRVTNYSIQTYGHIVLESIKLEYPGDLEITLSVKTTSSRLD